MWHAMFDLPVPLLEKVLRTVLVYALIVVLLRLAGKRGLASLNTLDLTVLLLLSNVVQNAIIGADNTIVGAAVGATVLVGVNSVLNHALARSGRVARVFEGQATSVIERGRTCDPALRRLGIRREQLEQAVRIQNGDGIDEVETGTLEPSGHLVLTLRAEEQSASKGDVADLRRQLDDIKAALVGLNRPLPNGG